MRHPFIVRVRGPDGEAARKVAAALREALDARPSASVKVVAAAHEEPLAVDVALRQDDEEPAWMPALPVSAQPDVAAREVLSFLERWGFVGARPAS